MCVNSFGKYLCMSARAIAHYVLNIYKSFNHIPLTKPCIRLILPPPLYTTPLNHYTNHHLYSDIIKGVILYRGEAGRGGGLSVIWYIIRQLAPVA